MKKATTLLVLVVIMMFVHTAPAFAAGTISVSGAGSITEEPDKAIITFNVMREDDSSAVAMEEVSRIMAEIIEILREFDIEDADMRTTRIDLTRQTRWITIRRPSEDEERAYITEQIPHFFFRASNNIIVTVRDLDILGYAIGAVIEAGATVSGNINFEITNASELYYLALEIAMRDARSRANAIARGGGFDIAGVRSVSETGSWNAPVARAAAPMAAASFYGDMAMDVADVAPYVPVMAGELTITARVSVVFVIADGLDNDGE